MDFDVLLCSVYSNTFREFLSSLSTDAFLQSFRCFIARRGRSITVHSDNSTNFVSAQKVFSGINWEQISAVAAVQRILWKFNRLPLAGVVVGESG